MPTWYLMESYMDYQEHWWDYWIKLRSTLLITNPYNWQRYVTYTKRGTSVISGFRRGLVLHDDWIWDRQVAPKRRQLATNLGWVISQKGEPLYHTRQFLASTAASLQKLKTGKRGQKDQSWWNEVPSKKKKKRKKRMKRKKKGGRGRKRGRRGRGG